MEDTKSEPVWAIPGKEKIYREDLRIETPDHEETAIILQRHEEYIRDVANPEAGSIKPEVKERAHNLATDLIKGVLEDLSPEERKTVDVMVIGSPTKYNGGGMRSMETAEVDLDAIRDVFKEYDLAQNQILNDQSRLTTRGKPIPSGSIVEPKMIYDSPEFVEWLKKFVGAEGMNLDFWIAYEGDKGEVKEKREEMGAEGPNEMADRLSNFAYALKLFSQKYHEKQPGRRLIIWAVTHTDTITPFIKKKVNGTIEGELAGVDYAGGIGINIHKDGKATTQLGEKTYLIDLVKASTASSIV